MNWTRTTTVRWHRPPARSDSIDPRAAIPCRLYWIYALDPRTNFTTLTLAYVGEVVDTPNRGPLVRFAEHMEDKPWSDTVPEHDPERALAAGILRISDSTYSCKQVVQAAEQVAIIHGRPLYNYEHNLDNADRITIPDARRARAERDAANRVPADQTWAAQEARRQAARTVVEPAARARWARIVRGRRVVTRRLTPRGRRSAAWGSAWALASLLLWSAAMWFVPVVSPPRLALLSGGLVGAVLVRLRRPRRRGWQQVGNTAVLVAIAVLMLVTAWAPAVGWLLAGR